MKEMINDSSDVDGHWKETASHCTVVNIEDKKFLNSSVTDC